MRTIYAFLLLTLTTFSGFAQAPDFVWDKYFGGAGGEARKIIKTTDGGFIIAGEAETQHEDAINFSGDPDAFIVKVDANYERQWSYCYGGQYGQTPFSIIQTSDGGFAIAGRSSAVGQTFNAWVLRLDAQGLVVWENQYGGTLEDYATGIIETATGDLVVSGVSRSTDGDLTTNKGNRDYWIFRLNSGGVIQSSNTYGGLDGDTSYSLVANDDGSVVVAGESFSESHDVTCRQPGICESDFWILKTSATGEKLWAKCFGSMYSGTNFTNQPASIIKTTDGGYFVVGKGYDNNTEQSFGKADFIAVKLDANGNLEWKSNYGGNEDDIASAVQQTSDGGYVIAGSSMSNDEQVSVDFSSTYLSSMRNGWVIKIDAAGVLQWQKAIGSDFQIDYLNDIVEVEPGSYIVVGRPGLASNNHTANSAGRRFWSVLLEGEALSTDDFGKNSVKIYPNPAQNILYISSQNQIDRISIYEQNGRKVSQVAGNNLTSADISSLASGLYIIQLTASEKTLTGKFIKN